MAGPSWGGGGGGWQWPWSGPQMITQVCLQPLGVELGHTYLLVYRYVCVCVCA